MQPESVTDVDLTARIELCHAALQHLAARVGADMLHIKGLAAEPEWRSRGRGSDADVLVRPSHVARVIAALDGDERWHRRSRFHTGSPFGHAQTYWHDHLGYADVHRFFPGMRPDDVAFDALWDERGTVDLAGVPVPVPSRRGQALVFLLNEVRNGSDVGGTGRLGELAVSDLGTEVDELVSRVGAQVAHAAALGELDRFREHREHDLWRAITTGSGRVEEWRARVKAQPSLAGKVLTVLRAPLVNTEHLTNVRGHEPSALEVAVEFLDRARRAAVEVWRSRDGRAPR